MATNNPPVRWRYTRPALLGVIQFAAVITILYYAAPFTTSKDLLAGVVVFLVALLVALFFSWPA